MTSKLDQLCLVAALLLGNTVHAQTQIKPRVILMVDTSGSMTGDFPGADTGGDGTYSYASAVMSRSIAVDGNLGLWAGEQLTNPLVCDPSTSSKNIASYAGTNSRMAAAKNAVTNVFNGSGNIEWGLERYNGTPCPILPHTFTNSTLPQPRGRCNRDGDCLNGRSCDLATHRCTCASAGTDCAFPFGNWACSGGFCEPTNDTACTGGGSGMIRDTGSFDECECNSNADCGMGECTSNEYCSCPGGVAPNADGTCPCVASTNCNQQFVCNASRCGTWSDFVPQGCSGNGDCGAGMTCSGGKCTCNNDNNCRYVDYIDTGFGDDADVAFCIGGICGEDLNLCEVSASHSATDQRHNQSCGEHFADMPIDYVGDCGGTPSAAGTAACATRRVCYNNADCGPNGSTCTFVAGQPYGECACPGGQGQCPDGINGGEVYACTGGFCVYNLSCITNGGAFVVNPAAAGYTPGNVLTFVNGIDSTTAPDPELRASGLTPFAGSARTVTAWYQSIASFSLNPANNCVFGTQSSTDPLCDKQLLCRPYVLVQITDGADTCESSFFGGAQANKDNGPINAAAGFVDATAANARVPNKVYVIGLAADTDLQTIANAAARQGGTGTARFADNQPQIEVALADIISSSVLTERCNYVDDDCNVLRDEPFPDINNACSNGAVGHCLASGKFKCSTDQLSQTCGPQSCRNGFGTSLTRSGNNMTLSGGSVTGFTAADVGRTITIVAARSAANKGTFTITAQGGTTVTFTNASGVAETGTGTEVGFEIQCSSSNACRQGPGGALTKAGNLMTLAGVTGFVAGDVGAAITIAGATNAVNNGTFNITAVGGGGTTVTFTNAAGLAQAAGSITFSIYCRDPSCRRGTGANFSGKSGSNITLTGGSGFVAGDLNQVITIRSASNSENVGNFVINQVISATSVRITNANGVNEGGGMVTWNLYCTNAEQVGGCNNFDDDCNGIPDDCNEGVAGSCCTSTGCLPVEVCNGLDDDCDGTIDDSPVDVGGACGNSVGNCSPGIIRCCTGDPSMGGTCPGNQASDGLFCVGGNPGYPTASDACDGTDGNCDGTPNGVPPILCYEDPAASPNPFPAALAGHGICQAGTKPCTTAPLPYGDPACPPGWPSPSPCPNPAATFGTCVNARGPQPEVCNGLDDDCDDLPDNGVSDAWVGTPCCPTGNLADCVNSGGSTQCQTGTLQCVGGGQSCVGGVAKTAEVCDGLDNDCDGSVDTDTPGVGSTCTANGVKNGGACVARFICVPQSPAPNCAATPSAPGCCDGVPCPNGLTCEQQGTAGVEVCNGIDDDCNDIVDDPALVMANDPALMMPCDVPTPPADKPPCMAGTPVCLNGKVECQGAVKPIPNQCGQAATDCTGNPSMECPPGSICFMGNCLTECGNGEFPCPGGFVCDRSQDPDLCVPDACLKANCPAGTNCTVGSDGMAVCTDPCEDVNCPSGFRCQNGACVDDSCRTFPCPPGEICVGNPGACQSDPCHDVECEINHYCSNGTCVPLCPATCMSGERCVDGMCQTDPCAGVKCTAGNVCAVVSGVGMCVTNMCTGTTCGIDQTCCGGACINDPCQTVRCPDGITCSVDDTCVASCSFPPGAARSEIVGAGGGGFTCDMGGRGGGGWIPLSMVLLWLSLRRRREGVR